MKLNKWKTTQSVIYQFSNIKSKQKHRFIKFDVKDFYPSISRNTPLEALALANSYCAISQDEIDTVVHCCKSVLIYKNCAWSKKDMDDGFDIPLGSFHGAEVCELVGLLILKEIEKDNIIEQNKLGIYRDDGLAIEESKSDPNIQRLSKRVRKAFNRFGLEITIESNLVKTDFMDVELDLCNNTFVPFRKPNF